MDTSRENKFCMSCREELAPFDNSCDSCGEAAWKSSSQSSGPVTDTRDPVANANKLTSRDKNQARKAEYKNKSRSHPFNSSIRHFMPQSSYLHRIEGQPKGMSRPKDKQDDDTFIPIFDKGRSRHRVNLRQQKEEKTSQEQSSEPEYPKGSTYIPPKVRYFDVEGTQRLSHMKRRTSDALTYPDVDVVTRKPRDIGGFNYTIWLEICLIFIGFSIVGTAYLMIDNYDGLDPAFFAGFLVIILQTYFFRGIRKLNNNFRVLYLTFVGVFGIITLMMSLAGYSEILPVSLMALYIFFILGFHKPTTRSFEYA